MAIILTPDLEAVPFDSRNFGLAASRRSLYDLMDSAYFGRVILKEVSAAYLLHKGEATEYQ
jgi:hypothetical protein